MQWRGGWRGRWSEVEVEGGGMGGDTQERRTFGLDMDGNVGRRGYGEILKLEFANLQGRKVSNYYKAESGSPPDE